MHILIIDDSQIWIKQGKALLEAMGHEVSSMLVTGPQKYLRPELPTEVIRAMFGVDLVMCDKDLGEGVESTMFLCVLRQKAPTLPIIRWTGGYERKPHMKWLHISEMDKPTKLSEAEFPGKFVKAVEEQRMLHSGPMFLFGLLKEELEAGTDEAPDTHRERRRAGQIEQLSEIVGLAADGVFRVPSEHGWWSVEGRAGGVTMHEFGHAICDGLLTADDIRPFLADLKKVVAKMRELDTVDKRFEICAAFIEAGDLDELELVQGCY